MPVELKMWLILGLGCLVISLAVGFLCAAVSGASFGDKAGMIGFGAITGVMLGTLLPPILVLGRVGVVESMSDVYFPMIIYASVALSLVFLVEMLSSFIGVPIFVIFRTVRTLKRKG